MSELIELEHDTIDDGRLNMGSINHSRAQGKLIVSLAQDERLEVMPELSIDLKGLDISQFGFKSTIELKPDISVYWQTPVPEAEPLDDLIRSPSPIEIISTSQTLTEMTNKVKAYFALDVTYPQYMCFLHRIVTGFFHLTPSLLMKQWIFIYPFKRCLKAVQRPFKNDVECIQTKRRFFYYFTTKIDHWQSLSVSVLNYILFNRSVMLECHNIH